jgi:hypothetical protein
MKINNNLITFSIILFRTEEENENNKLFYTSDTFFLWDHRTDTVKEIELPDLIGSHIINLSNSERETLWLYIFKKELSNLLNLPAGSELKSATINIYLNTIIYNNEIGGRYITNCIISFDNLSNWSKINQAEQEYNEIKILDIKNGNSFLKFYNEIITSPVYF